MQGETTITYSNKSYMIVAIKHYKFLYFKRYNDARAETSRSDANRTISTNRR